MNEQSLARSLHRFHSEEIYCETEKRVDDDDDDQYTSEERYFFIIIFSSLLKEEVLCCTCIYIYTAYYLSFRTLSTLTRN